MLQNQINISKCTYTHKLAQLGDNVRSSVLQIRRQQQQKQRVRFSVQQKEFFVKYKKSTSTMCDVWAEDKGEKRGLWCETTKNPINRFFHKIQKKEILLLSKRFNLMFFLFVFFV